MWRIKNISHKVWAVLGGCIPALFISSHAAASFLDTDFWCRTYGCAVVHDGRTYDIYDNYIFSINRCCVSYGSEMINYYNRADGTNITGTLTESDTNRPDSNESFMLNVSQGNASVNIFDDGDGYLDAGDTMSGFAIGPSTDIRLSGTGRQYSHSFFVSSRNTRFSLRGQAQITDITGDFANTISLSDIKLTPTITATGNDDGFSFGSRATTASTSLTSSIDDLSDLSGTATPIMNFGQSSGIRVRNGDIDTQTIRLDFLYTMPEYDLSMGTGSLSVDVEFDFYRER